MLQRYWISTQSSRSERHWLLHPHYFWSCNKLERIRLCLHGLTVNIRDYPTCNILRALLCLDVYTQTVVYAFLIKGWSLSRMAEHLGVSLITIQELLESGREELKRKLAESR